MDVSIKRHVIPEMPNPAETSPKPPKSRDLNRTVIASEESVATSLFEFDALLA